MTRIVAHRGASDIAPENTLPAFRKAVELGADGIELDVHMSADGELVVIHDASVKRTSGEAGLISELTLHQLRNLDFCNGMPEYTGQPIPLLQEVYELVRPTGLFINVEIKTNRYPYPGMEKKLLTLEHTMQMHGRILYSSFNHYTLKNIMDADPKAYTGVLYANDMVEPWGYAKYLKATALHPKGDVVLRYPGLIECTHALGLDVNVWTVDSPADMRRLLKMGVDGLITNRPDIGTLERSRVEAQAVVGVEPDRKSRRNTRM